MKKINLYLLSGGLLLSIFFYNCKKDNRVSIPVSNGCPANYLAFIDQPKDDTVVSVINNAGNALKAMFDMQIKYFADSAQVTLVNKSIGSIVSYKWVFSQMSGGRYTGIKTIDSLIPFYGLSDSLITKTSNVINPKVAFHEGTGTLKLIITDTNNQKDSIETVMNFDMPSRLFLPNFFSPDDDMINDTYYPRSTGILNTNYLMKVKDKQGNIIFQSSDLNSSWNGKFSGTNETVSAGLYNVELSFKCNNGNVKNFNTNVYVWVDGCFPRCNNVIWGDNIDEFYGLIYFPGEVYKYQYCN
jgi:gliding motility-associated-like protein